MEGIKKLGFTFNMTNLLVNQTAPVKGPGTSVSSGLGYGPLPSGFIGGRIAPRVVLVGGLYIETGYGSSFSGVRCVDGDEVVDGVPDTDPATCTNGEPQDLDVTFFVGEFAVGTSFRIHEKFWLGVALRLPFSKQVADLWQNVGAALVPPGSNTANYGRVKNNLGGVGTPALRFGVTIKPHKKVDIGIMYRVASKIKMTGTTETDVLTDPDTGAPLMLQSVADWNIPHAIAFGISSQVTAKALIALETRLQFHGAEKSGNQNQTVVASLPDGTVLSTIVIPFGWQNSWSVKAGMEYRFIDLFALRAGFNIAEGATTQAWAQYFTPPPGLSGNITLGFGFYWDDRNNPEVKDKYMLDLAGAFAFTTGTLDNRYDGETLQIPGTDPNDPNNFVEICSRDQVVRTGCPGKYSVYTYWASFSFTLQD
jgi:hypothetical protein